ncbi:MAG TPA: DNA gyrase inhibitor YacG [Allosphingosinicella sp.]|nr:DNA gyrase inhibitor YacG [Allosphingosinicella sp.]
MSTASSPSARRRGGCPLCGKPSNEAHKPFCGRGCRDRDLLNWLGDAYRVPGAAADPDSPDFAADGLDSEA